MDRYQFEDIISDYIENNLSLNQRQQVEAYLEQNFEAKIQIEAVKNVIASLKSLHQVKTSDGFMTTLHKRIAEEKEKKKITSTGKKLFAGYVPLMAVLSTMVVVLIIFLGMEFMPSKANQAAVQPFITEQDVKTPTYKPANSPEESLYAESDEDSTKMKDPSIRKNFGNRIQLVNDKSP